MVVASFLGTGCVGTEGVPPPLAPVGAAEPQAEALPPIPVPAPPRPQPQPHRTKTKTPTAQPTKVAEDPAPTPPPLAVRLKGLSEAEAETLLGRPVAVEEKAPARVWIYRVKACSVRVAFFPQMATLDFRVLSVELSEKGDEAARARCEADLLAARGGVGA